jgi:TRAP-type C4-dicarboxylate transport system permease large subunit
MHFRLLLQPLMAVIFAVLDGRKDALAGRPAYFWAMFTSPGHRKELLRSGWKSVGKIFIIAIVLDGVYQFITVRWFYPVEALVTAIVLAFVPYLLLRGPVNRLWPKKKGVAK